MAAAVQNVQLTAIHDSLLKMREHPDENQETRGATAELTTLKHRVIDWVETHLKDLRPSDDVDALTSKIRDEMDASDLFCMDYNVQCFPSSLGFLDEVRISRSNGFLIVRTAVGIWCGFDYSAYVYNWTGSEWRKIWTNEQNTYTAERYVPQILHAVQISTPDNAGRRVLMTLGSKPGCSSAFMPAYYRAWQLNDTFDTAGPWLNETELINLDSEPPVEGRVSPNDVLLRFTAGGTGYGDSHMAVRHFEVRNGQAIQVDPIAATPRDFVEEWLSAGWNVAGPRSESAELQVWHERLHRDDGQGDFPDRAIRCNGAPDLWQIGAHFQDAPKYYYKVRRRETFNFSMVAISESPFSDCTMPDPAADEHPQLFTTSDQ